MIATRFIFSHKYIWSVVRIQLNLQKKKKNHACYATDVNPIIVPYVQIKCRIYVNFINHENLIDGSGFDFQVLYSYDYPHNSFHKPH